MNGFWQRFIPDRFVHEGVQESVLLKFLEFQTPRIKDQHINSFTFLIFEDCIDQNFRYNKEVEKLFYCGRHFDTLALITSQWFTNLHPGVRSNADIVFIFSLQSMREIESVWLQYFGWFPKNEFPALLDRYTGVEMIDGKLRHKFLAIDNRAKVPGTSHLAPHTWQGVAGIDRTFWGYATEVPNFVLGCEVRRTAAYVISRHLPLSLSLLGHTDSCVGRELL